MIRHLQANHHTRRPTHALQLLFAVALGAGLMLMAVYTPVARAATIIVNTTADEINADGDAHTDTYAHRDAYTHTHADRDAHADTYCHTHKHLDRPADGDAYGNAFGDAGANRDRHV